MTSSDIGRDLQHLIRRTLSPFGRRFDPDVLRSTYAFFTPLQKDAPKDRVVAQRDIAYGAHERQRLDLHISADRPANAPIVVYVHGGGYVGGERSPAPGLIYDNVATFFARNGMVGVNATYRLAPQYRWPSGGEDVGLAVEWLRSNAGQFSGDPKRIFLIGQSAGGTHVATWAFIRSLHGSSGPGIAGAILLSQVLAPHDPVYCPGPPPPHRLTRAHGRT